MSYTAGHQWQTKGQVLMHMSFTLQAADAGVFAGRSTHRPRGSKDPAEPQCQVHLHKAGQRYGAGVGTCAAAGRTAMRSGERPACRLCLFAEWWCHGLYG